MTCKCNIVETFTMFQGGITAAQAIAAITNQNSLTSSTFTSSEEVLEAGLGSASTSESQAATSAAAYHRIHEGAAGASNLRDVVSKDTQTSNINVRLAYHCHIRLLSDDKNLFPFVFPNLSPSIRLESCVLIIDLLKLDMSLDD